MPSFSDVVWVIPLLYFIMFIMGLVIGKAKPKWLMVSIYSLSTAAFLWSCGILWERIFFHYEDYSFDINWLRIGDVSYQVGYELNNSSAWFLALIASMNLLLLILNRKKNEFIQLGYVGLMCAALCGVVLADHMFSFFIFSILSSCAAYILISNPMRGASSKAIYRFGLAQMFGYALFFIALVGLYWYMPNHSLHMTMLETVFSSSVHDFTPFMKNIIAVALLGSSLLIAAVIPYTNWLRHMDDKQSLLNIITFCAMNLLLPIYILLRFKMIIGSTDSIMLICKLAGLIIVLMFTLRMLLNAQQSQEYIGVLLLGSIVFAYGHGTYGYVLLQLTIIILSLIVIYGALMQPASLIAFGSNLIALLTLIGVPPLGGYWMQQSLVATIAQQGPGWYILSLLIVLCCAMGMTIYVSTLWKSGMESTGKGRFSIIIVPAAVLIGLGLVWLVKQGDMEIWLFGTVISQSIALVPMLLTMISIVVGVAVAWLFSERITEAFSASLQRTDTSLKHSTERLGLTLSKLGTNIVKTEQWVERGLEQLLTLWLPYPIRMISRLGAKRSFSYSMMLVVILSFTITVLWYGLRGR